MLNFAPSDERSCALARLHSSASSMEMLTIGDPLDKFGLYWKVDGPPKIRV